MVDIETLINHFLSVSWGQPMPAGEAMISTEAPKGIYGYYVISDGGNWPYRCRIRTPSFPHLQTLPMLSRGLLVSDLIAILGSLDYVLGDVDRWTSTCIVAEALCLRDAATEGALGR